MPELPGDDEKEKPEPQEKGKEEQEEEKNESKKDKRIQAVDAACGGLIFYRFRVDVKPTDFVSKLFQHMAQLDPKERDQEVNKIRHCAVS